MNDERGNYGIWLLAMDIQKGRGRSLRGQLSIRYSYSGGHLVGQPGLVTLMVAYRHECIHWALPGYSAGSFDSVRPRHGAMRGVDAGRTTNPRMLTSNDR